MELGVFTPVFFVKGVHDDKKVFAFLSSGSKIFFIKVHRSISYKNLFEKIILVFRKFDRRPRLEHQF
jgi:hypothetical protein